MPAQGRISDFISRNWPGALLCALIALGVRFVSDNLGGPAMLYALLVGMAFHFLSDNPRFTGGIRLMSRNVLRVGVALLGVRISTADIVQLGWPVIMLVLSGVVVTILLGQLVGRFCRLSNHHALLSAGAVAICGASAALAIASVLPQERNLERNTVMTVASVTALSTVAMVLYPVLVVLWQYDDVTAGVFLGMTIHDVAQVVGAGYMISPESGDLSTLVKLMRVACLVPVIFVISLALSRKSDSSPSIRSTIPGFLVAFIVLAICSNAGWIPSEAHSLITPVSNWCLLAAVAAMGVKTSLGAFVDAGPAPVAAMVLQTLLLGLFAVAGLWALA